VGELVRHAVTELLARGELPDPVFARAFVTIPEVRMSPDLRLATVYVTLHERGLEKAVLKALAGSRKQLRTEIAHRVNLKFAPDLRFLVDDRLDEAARIDALLRSPEVRRDLESGREAAENDE
jgi:ribosome-binding factor A